MSKNVLPVTVMVGRFGRLPSALSVEKLEGTCFLPARRLSLDLVAARPEISVGEPMKRKTVPISLLLIPLLFVAMVSVQNLQATTIIVTNTNDSGPGSLRQALADANNGDAINFDSSLNGGTITLFSGELVVNKSLTI